ncbi:hypothetical protein [Rheinheimera sp.]|uniref:hypothetical protein n=1 Tax=Rheinheimera sp. TaxID=1869214 RepID=UPI0037C604CA
MGLVKFLEMLGQDSRLKNAEALIHSNMVDFCLDVRTKHALLTSNVEQLEELCDARSNNICMIFVPDTIVA